MPERSLFRRSTYACIQWLSRLVGVALFSLRVEGRQHILPDGGGLVCANHQSYFDPLIVGLSINRRMNFLARKTLFRFAPFRWFIEHLDSIPIDRDGFGLEGLKETIRRVKSGELVLIFPEGTRTRDGKIAPLKPGFCTVARRAKANLIPVGFDGAFDVWPRTAFFPRLATVHVVIGETILAADIEAMSDEEVVAELERRLRACFTQARAGR